MALAAWPLATGLAPERQLAFSVPSWWHQAAREVDRMPAGERAMVLPGALFAYYDWGGTVDPILPALADRPVAERMIVPFADLRAVDLQFATDALVSQERALPGQLPPLLDLMGVGRVFSAADGDRSRSGGIGPVEADQQLRLGGLAAGTPIGPTAPERAAAGRVPDGRRLPRITMRSLPTGGMVRVVPRDRATIVDGGAEGIAQLAGFGGLRPGAALRYAADVTPEEIRRTAAEGGRIVVTRQQPAPGVRRRPPAGQPRPRAARLRVAVGGRRDARPVPGAQAPTPRPSPSSTASPR